MSAARLPDIRLTCSLTLLLSRRSKIIAANLTRWTGSVPEITGRKVEKGPGKGITNFLSPFMLKTCPEDPVLLGTADFRGSPVRPIGPQWRYLLHRSLFESKSHAERVPSNRKKLQIQGAALPNQRKGQEKPLSTASARRRPYTFPFRAQSMPMVLVARRPRFGCRQQSIHVSQARKVVARWWQGGGGKVVVARW